MLIATPNSKTVNCLQEQFSLWQTKIIRKTKNEPIIHFISDILSGHFNLNFFCRSTPGISLITTIVYNDCSHCGFDATVAALLVVNTCVPRKQFQEKWKRRNSSRKVGNGYDVYAEGV